LCEKNVVYFRKGLFTRNAFFSVVRPNRKASNFGRTSQLGSCDRKLIFRVNILKALLIRPAKFAGLMNPAQVSFLGDSPCVAFTGFLLLAARQNKTRVLSC
jgi:hypothetical protein